jgi:hypothetical protein
MREYGKPNFGATIAAFNGMSTGMRLAVGQELRMPVIHPNGSLTPSSAPAPAPFVLPSQPIVADPLPVQGLAPQAMQMNADGGSMVPQGPFNGPMSVPNGTVSRPTTSALPAANIRVASEERLPSTVAVGSTLSLDGQALGGEKGIVRLRINGLVLAAEVLEWSTDSVKIRLPELDLEGPMKAEIEVLRADGSLASKTAIQLTSAATRLALGN